MAGRHRGRAAVDSDGVSHGRRAVIATALALLLGGLPVNTEIIFHRRDHVDQGKYLSNQPRYNVRSYPDALVSHR